MECPENMVFTPCMSECQPNCVDPEGSLCTGDEPCMEGCICEDGLVYDGESCIKPEECGCYQDGLLYQVNQDSPK